MILDPIPLALVIAALTLAVITGATFAALVISGHYRKAREADRRAAESARRRVRATIEYSVTMDRTPAPEGLSPERLKARAELLDASDRIARARTARKSTKRAVASAVRARAELLAMDLKMKRTAP